MTVSAKAAFMDVHFVRILGCEPRTVVGNHNFWYPMVGELDFELLEDGLRRLSGNFWAV